MFTIFPLLLIGTIVHCSSPPGTNVSEFGNVHRKVDRSFDNSVHTCDRNSRRRRTGSSWCFPPQRSASEDSADPRYDTRATGPALQDPCNRTFATRPLQQDLRYETRATGPAALQDLRYETPDTRPNSHRPGFNTGGRASVPAIGVRNPSKSKQIT